ncbi:MAG: glutaredoxin family protein [Chloroflexota bacterium]|nr:glutaredoxin family protein [Chloroflexota bacterium]
MAEGVPEVVLYTREGCRLCIHARDALRRLARDVEFEVRAVDVDGDPALAERYGESVPVVTVEGVEVSTGRIDVAAVRWAVADRAE